MAILPPIPYRVPIADRQGLIDRNWQQFFEALLARTGGVGDVPSNEELAEVAFNPGFSTEVVAIIAGLERRLTGIESISLTGEMAEVASLRTEINRLSEALTLGLLDTMVSPTPIAKDFYYEVAAGRLPGKRSFNKFGRTTNADSAVNTDVWDRANPTDNQAIYVAPTQARTHQIVSTSANDTAAGTGLRTMRVYGLIDWDTAEVSEDITMNGTTNVPTVNEYVIIYREQALTWGTAGPNVGTITATADTDATVSAQIAPGDGQTQMAIFAWPSTETLMLTDYYVSMNSGTPAGTNVNGLWLLNPIPDSQLDGFLVKSTTATVDDGTSHFSHSYKLPPRFPGPGIIKMQAVSDSNNADVSAGFDVVLEKN